MCVCVCVCVVCVVCACGDVEEEKGGVWFDESIGQVKALPA